MEADNDIFCSSGTRRSDATVSVCCKRMSVGETCVKCGDISCCWICVSLTLRKWGVPACSLSDRRVYPASQTRSQSQSHTDTHARPHTHTQLHRVIDTTQTSHSVHTVNTYVSLAVAGPDPKDWFPLQHRLCKYSHHAQHDCTCTWKHKHHGTACTCEATWLQPSVVHHQAAWEIIQFTTRCHIKTTPKTRECIYAPSWTSVIYFSAVNSPV